MKKNRQKEYHRMYGQHSNIPECCIDFWLTDWENIMTFHRKEYDDLVKAVETKLGKKYGYIPCYTCLDNKRLSQIHLCTGETCRDFYISLKNKTGCSFHE